MELDKVISNDGTLIAYQKTGRGPGLIIIHGVLSQAANYHVLAEALSEDFTVYLIERRGRGLSGPQGDHYSLEKECADLFALQSKVKAHYLFGHSYGGLIALESVRNNDIFKKIAVYDPGVDVDGVIEMGWTTDYKKLLAKGQLLTALAVFSKNSGPEKAKKTPLWLMKLMLPLFIDKNRRTQMFSLLQCNLNEHMQVANKNNSYPNYSEINAKVLLMSSGASGLIYVPKAMNALSEVLHSYEVKIFPKLGHFAPDQTAPAEIAQALTAFFTANTSQ
jgi:pimeloyl-ACP methyl ester carboxylesterase